LSSSVVSATARTCQSANPFIPTGRRCADRVYPPPSFDGLLSRHKLAITGRFHGATACLLTRTPFIAVESNMPKIAALLHDAFGSKSRLFAMEQVERAYLTAFSSWIAAESAAINRYYASGAKRCQHMASELASIIRERNSQRKVEPQWSNKLESKERECQPT
jgi:hypothetical protein